MTSGPSDQRGKLIPRGRAIMVCAWIAVWWAANGLPQEATLREVRELDDYVGWYELESKRVGLMTWAAAGGLRLYDFEGHASHDLSAHGASSFIWKGGDDSPNRTGFFERDATGDVVRFRWRADGGGEGFVRRLPGHGYTQSEVRFANKEVELVGTLLMPRSAPPHPGVVFLHGSGTSDRDNLWYFAIADRFAQSGFAVLLPDKRGSGKSSGEWQSSSFHDFAGDALAAVGILTANELVDPNRVGLIGVSQGGWIAPLAADSSPDVAFVVSVGGAAVTPNEQLLHESKQSLIQKGMPISMAGAMASTAASIAKARRSEWWAQNGEFDPIPYLERLRIPILFIYGEEDEADNVPVRESVNRLEKAVDSSPHSRLEVRVFSDTGHGLIDRQTNWIRENFLDLLMRWTREASSHQ